MPEAFDKILKPEQEEAALLLSKAELSYGEVAAKVGVHSNSIYNWKKNPIFVARVAELRAQIRDEVTSIGIAEITNRVRSQSMRWKRLHRVIEERADDPELQNIPGGRTGLIVHNVKGVGVGDNFQMVDLYEVDTGTLKALLDLEKQAAQELGQWQETKPVAETQKHEHVVKIEWPDEEAARLRAAFNISAPARPTDGSVSSELQPEPEDN